MLKRLGIGFALGYVAGSRAGEERYEQIAAAARRIADLPGVRDLVNVASPSLDDAKERLSSAWRARVSYDAGDASDGEDEAASDGEADGAEDEEPDDEVRKEPEHAEETDDLDAEASADEGRRKPDKGVAERGSPSRGLAGSLAEFAAAAIERGRVA